ncbi:MAG: YceI family protein [Bacteroidia bacterium]|nr:YceI family protein [Bacteroidia bacterium]NNF31354.1 YceI family protein [Flavobacteriaceae bacterium]MBT8276570.1 YceI family protein [Bacteroidia bacterium]NNJ82864.1 YceI family protein [Flavobacteriaceae bacterium]NNK54372.1 YceI family protein [Flavobacteriaceae bacterium]
MNIARNFWRFTLLIGIALVLNAFTGPSEDLQKLTAETNHSSLLFSVPIANGITRITGKYNEYTIDLDYVDKDFTKSVLSATIKAASIDTGIDGRDEHLRSSDFFDVGTYPEITFRSDRIVETDIGYTAIGNFTLHGVTKELEIPFVITGMDGENTLGISSRLSIDRTDYGVGNDFKHTSIENFISNTIDIEIDFWTKKRKEPKKEE